MIVPDWLIYAWIRGSLAVALDAERHGELLAARRLRAVTKPLVAVIAIVVLLVGCSGGPASTKFTQTWTKPYGDTTCEDWRSIMDEHQKFVMAGDILLTQQRKVKADAAIPDDGLIGQFQGQIQGLCLTHPSDEASTAAFIVWTGGQDVFAPK